MIFIYFLIAVSLAIAALCLTRKEKGVEVFFNVLILGLTAVVLIWNMDTADQGVNKSLNQNLRPIILRTFSLDSLSINEYWNRLEVQSSTILAFDIYDHIATNINGYIILNHKKFILKLFYSYKDASGRFQCLWKGNPVQLESVFWAAPINGLCAYFNKTPPININENNQICIQYEDISGNSYFTKEDEGFSTVSGMGVCSN